MCLLLESGHDLSNRGGKWIPGSLALPFRGKLRQNTYRPFIADLGKVIRCFNLALRLTGLKHSHYPGNIRGRDHML